MAEVGPDGNVWVIDWYSYIVQHNPTPPGFKTGKGGAYSTELRNSKFGRIYKIVPENSKDPQPKITLKGATPENLVATLKNDNMFWRLHAQRLLIERGQEGCCSGTDQARRRIALSIPSGSTRGRFTLCGRCMGWEF